jgi:ubiquinone/menaquinone biosynthesis C-methylase UbiE
MNDQEKDNYNTIDISGADTDKPINVARRLRVSLPFLPEVPCRLLDCGCGSGGYVQAFNSLNGVETHGLEYEVEKVRLARQKRGVEADRILQGDIQAMPYEDGYFDAVLLNEVLEHIPDQHKGLSEINRILRPGGILLIFSPNRYYPFETHGVYLKRGMKRVPHYMPFIPWIPLPLGQKVFSYPARNYWPGELSGLLQQQGFRILHRDYIWQTFENISGAQPSWMKGLSGLLRKTAFFLEHVPLVRRLGLSQFLAMEKPLEAAQDGQTDTTLG